MPARCADGPALELCARCAPKQADRATVNSLLLRALDEGPVDPRSSFLIARRPGNLRRAPPRRRTEFARAVVGARASRIATSRNGVLRLLDRKSQSSSTTRRPLTRVSSPARLRKQVSPRWERAAPPLTAARPGFVANSWLATFGTSSRLGQRYASDTPGAATRCCAHSGAALPQHLLYRRGVVLVAPQVGRPRKFAIVLGLPANRLRSLRSDTATPQAASRRCGPTQKNPARVHGKTSHHHRELRGMPGLASLPSRGAEIPDHKCLRSPNAALL